MDQDREWAKEHTSGIGSRIAENRRQRGISAQQLADRCAELGMPSLNRAVITKLENGHRDTIGTAQLLVLAKALDITPMLLLFPLGTEAATEIAPGCEMSTWEAVRWFYGVPRPYIALGSGREEGEYSMWDADDPVALFETHDQWVHFYEIVAEGGEHTVNGITFAEELAGLIGTIREERSRIRHLGMIPPDAPPCLPQLDNDAWPASYSHMLAGIARESRSHANVNAPAKSGPQR
jgi:transcriptional regulator with XRE-family HTH domain